MIGHRNPGEYSRQGLGSVAKAQWVRAVAVRVQGSELKSPVPK